MPTKGWFENRAKSNFFVNLGLYYSATVYFHINFLKKCYTITADMILIHLELFSKGLGPNRAWRRDQTQFFHNSSCYPKTCEKIWEKVKIVLDRPTYVVSEIAIKQMQPWCRKEKFLKNKICQNWALKGLPITFFCRTEVGMKTW